MTGAWGTRDRGPIEASGRLSVDSAYFIFRPCVDEESRLIGIGATEYRGCAVWGVGCRTRWAPPPARALDANAKQASRTRGHASEGTGARGSRRPRARASDHRAVGISAVRSSQAMVCATSLRGFDDGARVDDGGRRREGDGDGGERDAVLLGEKFPSFGALFHLIGRGPYL